MATRANGAVRPNPPSAAAAIHLAFLLAVTLVLVLALGGFRWRQFASGRLAAAPGPPRYRVDMMAMTEPVAWDTYRCAPDNRATWPEIPVYPGEAGLLIDARWTADVRMGRPATVTVRVRPGIGPAPGRSGRCTISRAPRSAPFPAVPPRSSSVPGTIVYADDPRGSEHRVTLASRGDGDGTALIRVRGRTSGPVTFRIEVILSVPGQAWAGAVEAGVLR